MAKKPSTTKARKVFKRKMREGALLARVDSDWTGVELTFVVAPLDRCGSAQFCLPPMGPDFARCLGIALLDAAGVSDGAPAAQGDGGRKVFPKSVFRFEV